MPPSPVMRVSLGRELKVENHKRGRSLGSMYREKEDDLALFSDVRNKERDALKLRYFSDYKVGVSVPARGEGSDLLNADKDKHDYDWLITPPETPLFRSLDDESQPINLEPRGGPRNQPVSISQSPTKDYRSGSRGSASPHRLSPSAQSGNSVLQSRSRPTPATHSSSPATMRHPSPVRRLSPPPSKLIPAPRSTTPIPRRMSTGSTGTSTPSRVRGSSPIKTNRGNSASPKTRAWQTNIPGFSSEVPPNLRTSLADRPGSHVRRASPTSRTSRQSLSPIASRSVASSHSHDRDPFISYNKGLVALSVDDDADSPQSIRLNSSEHSPRNTGAHPSEKAINFTKNPMKKLSSSAPKRSFDMVRQMDRKGPQDMFRPLLSSVPSSTFHAGKTTAHHHSPISRMTTSSNASSDQAAGRVHDIEGSGLNREDVTSDGVEGRYLGMDDEVFAMEKADALAEGIEENRNMEDDSLGARLGENDVPPLVVPRSSSRLDATATMESLAIVLKDTASCSKCGQMLCAAEVVTERGRQICLECRFLDVPSLVMVGQNNSQNVQTIHGPDRVLDQSASISECARVSSTRQTEKTYPDTQYSDLSLNLSVELFEGGEHILASQKMIEQSVGGDNGCKQLQHDEANSSSSLDVSEGAGISLLLKRSSGQKGHILQSRSFSASASSYDDFSYVRDGGASASSSIDLGSCGHKPDAENYRYEMHAKHKRSVSSMSTASGHMSLVTSFAPSCHEDGFEVIAGHVNTEFEEDARVHSREISLASEFTEAESACSYIESNIVFKTASESVLVDDAMPKSCADRADAAEVRNASSLNPISEIEIENDEVVYYDSNSDIDSTDSKGCSNELQLHDAEAAVLEESRSLSGDMVEGNAKSLTLEEAADVILFCSSIVHNLAYEAANIAIDNEALPVEALQPGLTFVGKSSFKRRDTHFKKLSYRSQKSQKKSAEMEAAPSSCKAETYELSNPCIVVGPPGDGAPDTGDSMEPPKLESKCNCILM